MCGIAGILNFNGERADPALLQRMSEMIHHRGPDDSGIFASGPAGLAHTRLSIIDRAGGRQPMHDAEKTLWITFSGEIFNYRELRRELIAKGYRFTTQSDTEVVMHLYREKGDECVRDFNGQWAFAIWDERRQRLFLSRDRVGVRPLFYTLSDQALVFGSEIKAVFAHPGIRRKIDLQALDQVFTFWSTVSPKTIFKGIFELPPGHSMVVEAGRVRSGAYWHLRSGSPLAVASEEESAGVLLDLLRDATSLRLRSEAPAGLYLSGGLDSAVIAALARQHLAPSPLKTFSIAFEDPEFDEGPSQGEVSRFFGTDHTEFRCSDRDIARAFPEVIWHAETPLLRTAPAPLFLLSQLVRDRGYKVALTGEGADEILGGYDIFKEVKIRKFCGVRPSSTIRPLLLKRLYPYQPNLRTQPESYLRHFFASKPEDLGSPFFSHLPRWRMTAGLKRFFSDGVRSELMNHDALHDVESMLPTEFYRWDDFSRAQYLETTILLPGYILSSQGDRMSMAHSVEVRHPFLDHRIIEFAAGIPPRLKMKTLIEKYILKKSAGHLLPGSFKRRPKRPYRAPEARSIFGNGGAWPQDREMSEFLGERRIQKTGLFDRLAVQRLFEKIKSGKAIGMRDNMAFTAIWSTELLVDQFVENYRGVSAHSIH